MKLKSPLIFLDKKTDIFLIVISLIMAGIIIL